MKLDLVFGLTMYQPPTQFPGKFQEIANESYRPVLNSIKEHPQARICLAVTTSTLEQAAELMPDVLTSIYEGSGRARLHLVNTAAYHPIFPCIPQAEQIWQMQENLRAYKGYLAADDVPSGFYLPEMAISEATVVTLNKQHMAWTIADDESYVGHHRSDPPFNRVPTYSGVAVLFQSHFWQRRISMNGHPSGRKFLADLKDGIVQWKGRDACGYMVIWMDFETFGHHVHGYAERFFGELFDVLSGDDSVRLCYPHTLLASYPHEVLLHVPRGSQSTSREDYLAGNWYPKWQDSRIRFHRLWWEMAYLCMEVAQRTNERKNPHLKRIGHKMLYSCQTWQYVCGNPHLAQLGLPYFGQILLAGTASEQEKGRALLAKLYELTRSA